MNVTSTITTNANAVSVKFDKKMIQQFLMHLAGELHMQRMLFEGKTVEARFRQGVERFRSKYGTHLVPDGDAIFCMTDSKDKDEEIERRRISQEMTTVRAGQLRNVLAVLHLLEELDFNDDPQTAQ